MISTVGLLYWVFSNGILRKAASRLGFKQFVYLQKLARDLIIVMIIIGVTSLLMMLLVGVGFMQAQIILLFFSTFWFLMFIVFFFAPFLDAFSVEGAAVLSLKQFSFEYEKNPKHADFALLQYAASNIAQLVKPYKTVASPNLITLGLSTRLLKDKKSNSLITLSNGMEDFPANSNKVLPLLEEIVSLASNLESKGLKAIIPRLSADKLLRYLSYSAPIAAAAATLGKVLVG